MAGYFEELKRRNVFRAVVAYIVLAWILLQVSTNLEEALNLPAWFDALVSALLVIGLPIVIVFSWVYEITPNGILKTEDVPDEQSVTPRTGRRLDIFTAVGVVVLIGLVVADKFTGTREPSTPQTSADSSDQVVTSPVADTDKSIAVLPFVAMTDSRDDEFFADGLSEELLNVLAKIEELKVAGRTSSFYYKGRNEDLRTIAESLGVAHILEGSVRRSGDKIRVTAQLIKADDGFHLWSETYDRSSGDIFDIQDEISRSVAGALKAEILGESVAEAPSANSIEAENLHLIARAAIAERDLAGVRRARDMYAKASVLDPANPKYLAGFAHAIALQYWNYRDIPGEEAIGLTSEAIQKALNLGKPNADTLAIAGLVEELRTIVRNDQKAKQRALDYYQQAVSLEPSNVLALQWLASIYLDIREPELARQTFEKVVELDPLNTLSLAGLANAYVALGQLDLARTHLFKMITLFPERGVVHRYMASVEYQAGYFDRYVYWMQKAAEIDPNPFEVGSVMGAYVYLGWADDALETAEEYRQVADGLDVSAFVQAQLDHDLASVSREAKSLHAETGDQFFALTGAWADAVIGRCDESARIIERQYPSTQGEVFEYLENNDLVDVVLLAHCYTVLNREREAQRLIDGLLSSGMLSDDALHADRTLKIIRVGLHAVAQDFDSAITDLRSIESDNISPLVYRLSIPIDEIPIFESILDLPEFQDYAKRERYQIAQQARQLAAGETQSEVVALAESQGYTLRN